MGIMTGRATLGEFEMLVMAAVLRLGDAAYGVPIREEILRRTGRDVSPGMLYKTLRRLEDKGLVSSVVGEATPVRGGRAKVYYRVEGAGAAALRESVTGLTKMLSGLRLGSRST
jgi:DNA-binding PadR family transcriptional regulator